MTTSEYQDMPDFEATSELVVREDPVEPIRSEQLLQAFGVNVEQQVKQLQKVAELAPEIVKYRSIIIKSFTYPSDWVKFGSGEKAKACCSNHAVMRIVDKANFPIRYRDIHSTKESILDEDGRMIGYRYVYEGYGEMGDRNVYAIGQYSTRDAFLGKSSGEWRDWREINESHIRQAAHSFFKGNVVKDLLGLKALPWDEFEKLCDFAGQVAEKASTVNFREGSQGGTADVDRTSQNELFDILTKLASENKVVRWRESSEGIEHYVDEPTSEHLDFASGKPDPISTLAQISLKALTTWKNKDGKLVQGTGDFSKIKKAQLSFLTKKKMPELMEKSNG